MNKNVYLCACLMLCFPNAKINLGLCVTRRRPDGYHDLQTVFYPVGLTDALEVLPADQDSRCTGPARQPMMSGQQSASPTGHVPHPAPPRCHLHRYGLPLEGDVQQDLVVRAYRLLGERYDLPPVEVHLLKGIPSGAGLGGGSADAAFMLRTLDAMFHLDLGREELERYAATLGADCAVFIANRPVYAEGIGNVFTPIDLSLRGYGIEVVRPNVFVSTREAFAHITPRPPRVPLLEVIRRPVSTWRDTMVNDFEESVFPRHPIIADLKRELYDRGAVYAAMTGSGSSVFGLFAPGVDWPARRADADADADAGMFVYRGRLD